MMLVVIRMCWVIICRCKSACVACMLWWRWQLKCVITGSRHLWTTCWQSAVSRHHIPAPCRLC